MFVHFEPLDHEAMNREDKESPKLQRQSQTKDSSLLSKLFSTRREERHAAAGHEQLQHDEESLEHHDHDHHLDAIEGGETIDSIVEKRRHRDLELSASAGERKNPVSAPAAKEEDVFAPSVEDKFAALRHAASHGDVSTLQVLLDKQSLRREDENKWQLLHEAIRAGDLASVKFLVESGADLHAKVKDGGGALWLGRKFWDDKHPVIKYLVQVGAPES